MKYTKEELASMAKQSLAAIEALDPRGIHLMLQLMNRFRVDQSTVLSELKKLAEAV